MSDVPCPMCGRPTIQVLGATVRPYEGGGLVLQCVDCWDKEKGPIPTNVVTPLYGVSGGLFGANRR